MSNKIASVPTDPWPAMMSDQVAAVYLGRSASWVKSMRAKKSLPARVCADGARYAYRRSDLDRWIASLPTEDERVEEHEASAADEAFGMAS